MSKISGKLTIFFENPFWVGVFEKVIDKRLSVCKVVFGSEPKDYEVYDFVLKEYDVRFLARRFRACQLLAGRFCSWQVSAVAFSVMTGRRRGLCGADLRSGHGHFQTGLVEIADEGGFEAALHVVQQLEAVSHIAQGDAVALAALAGRHGVGDLDHGDLAAKARGNAQLRAAGARLHAVLDGVFHQRLQDQRRQACGQRARIQRPLHAQALAKADLLNVQIAPRQLDFLRQRGAVALLGKSVAEQVRQVFQHALGLFRLAAHQGDGGVERVEQKVRAAKIGRASCRERV